MDRRQRENRVAELVNTAMNRKTWKEKSGWNTFVIPYSAVYEQVAHEWVDRVTWEHYPPRGWIVTPGGEAGFLNACAKRVTHYEAIQAARDIGWREMCQLVHADD